MSKINQICDLIASLEMQPGDAELLHARNHSNEPRQCARTACLDREGSGKTRRSPIKERFSAFIEKHPVIFCVVLAFFFIVLWNAVEEYSRACRKEWGSKWENNTKITVYEFGHSALLSDGYCNRPCPRYPPKRTLGTALHMSAFGGKRT